MDEFDRGQKSDPKSNSQILIQGVGWKNILAKLNGVPGINQSTVTQDLAHQLWRSSP
jgi:hypothetical protein